MPSRRSVRADKRDRDEERAEEPEADLAEEPEDDLAEEPEDDLAEEPEDDLPDEEPGDAGRRSGSDHRDGVTAAKAGQIALRQIAELTGKEPEGVTGVEPAEDTWLVGVEVVEDRRIPSSTDILATYETELGMDGELVSYRRVKRYTRGRGDSGGS